jgi:hypothetical protein
MLTIRGEASHQNGDEVPSERSPEESFARDKVHLQRGWDVFPRPEGDNGEIGHYVIP